MDDKYLISIIVPIYNTYKYIDTCLTSIRCQKYTKWECILCDDGSTDGSSEKCEEWCSKDNRFKVFHLQHNGPSAARNKGILESNGEYIAFIDSDDWVTNTYISDMVKEADEADLVISGLAFNNNGINTKTFIPGAFKQFPLTPDFSCEFIEYFMKKPLFHSQCCKLYDASIIKSNMLFFPENINLGEDLRFNLRYIEKVRSICFLPIVNYFYRKGERMEVLSQNNKIFTFENIYSELIDKKDTLKIIKMWQGDIIMVLYTELWDILRKELYSENVISYRSINSILSHLELKNMRPYMHSFSGSTIDKYAILHKKTALFVFILVCRRIKSYLLRTTKTVFKINK